MMDAYVIFSRNSSVANISFVLIALYIIVFLFISSKDVVLLSGFFGLLGGLLKKLVEF